ncbi:hypothetical protein ACFP1L_11955 [Lactiplantibacillus nangangensis]|uniref:Uncharacterized protein n=1 Tax=Lactiplantibacillus nangangensis TaxID=2559917 RepID=A0ABW1SLU6_9LACO|nr:hypothetical protein [Lactiplantibacillus nangangensis]
MNEDFSDMLAEFGIPLIVTLPDSDHPAGHIEHGTWVPDIVPPTEVIEPLIVPSSSALQSEQVHYGEGGQTTSYDALWYSEFDVPNGTTVQNKRNNHVFKVNYQRDYSDYSDVHCYEMRGVNNHG